MFLTVIPNQLALDIPDKAFAKSVIARFLRVHRKGGYVENLLPAPCIFPVLKRIEVFS